MQGFENGAGGDVFPGCGGGVGFVCAARVSGLEKPSPGGEGMGEEGRREGGGEGVYTLERDNL